MGQGSLTGKKIIITKGDFVDEVIELIEKFNQCLVISSIDDSFEINFDEYDHFLCKFTFSEASTKTLFKKIGEYPELAGDFLISPEDYSSMQIFPEKKIKSFDQKVIDESLEKYPEFFKNVDPDYFKNRAININVTKFGKEAPQDIAIFCVVEQSVQLVCKQKISDASDRLEIAVRMKLGSQAHEFEIILEGKLNEVSLEMDDQDNVYCYEYNLTKENSTYTELLEAIQKQYSHLGNLFGIEEDS